MPRAAPVTTEPVSKSEYARLRGCAPSAITRALKEGRIKATADGKIDVATADAAWADSTRARVDSKPAAAPPKPSAGPAIVEFSYADARARREHLGAQMAELDYKKRAGELIDAAQARTAVRDAFHELRDALGRLPRRISGLVAGLAEPRDVERIVERELRAVLEAFARLPAEALNRKPGA